MSTVPIKVIFGTSNKAKLAQMRFVIAHFALPVEIVSAKELLGERAVYEEIGTTVEEVVLNGAAALAAMLGAPVITEDTDFRVEALGDAPGIRSGEFLKNFGRGEILKKMEGVTDRRAVINSAVGYAAPGGAGNKVFVNRVHGTIALAEKFGAGFPDWIAPSAEAPFGGGYNAIFIPDGHDGKTLAEIDPEEAIPWSYRERNFIDALNYILGLGQRSS